MRPKLFSLCLVFVLCGLVTAAQQSSEIILHTPTGDIHGTLQLPAAQKKVPVVLIIAGSGPTDRDGNNKIVKNNSLKMLADSLQQHGIATVRYDKRGIAESKAAAPDEKDLRFDNYIDDVVGWMRLLKKDKRFSKLFVAGHSEGSLIGMAAASRTKADGFISIAGAGERADKVLRKQLAVQIQPQMVDSCNNILDKLVAGEHVPNTDKKLDMLFRASVQDYLISWFKYDPQAEIAKLKIPVLIIQGTTDMQVDTAQAHMLAAAAPKAKLVIIEKMNHIFKESEADRQKNMEVYMNGNLPVMTELVTAITDFVWRKK
jgi:pimeloyl-ACP methyl ester carboxylesterase